MVPTIEEFRSYFELAKWEPSQELIEATSKVAPNLDDVNAIVKWDHSEWAIHCAKLDKHLVSKWFFEQPSTKIAINAMMGRRTASVQTWEGWLQAKSRRMLDRRNSRFIHNDDAWRNELGSFINNKKTRVSDSMLHIFYEYFYTEHWRELVKISRNWRDTYQTALASIATLSKLETDIELIGRFQVGIHGWLPGLAISRLMRLQSNLQHALEHSLIITPIKREDQTARERVIVYDMFGLLDRSRYKNIAESILSLLLTEGVENQLDLRTIEKMISRWKREHREALRASKQMAGS